MAKVYYKATRPDGLDFYSGTVDYGAALRSGERVKVRTAARDHYSCCTGDVLHAADVPTETLIGGSWPCRLFEVTGRPVAQEGHKYGFRSLRVVRELPAHDVFGPQGVHVAALIEHARRLTAGEVDGLHAARSAAVYAAWDAAWSAAGNATLDAAGDAALGAAGDAAWDAAGNAAGNAALDAVDTAVYAAWSAAMDAALGAALALLVRDLISTEHYDTLTMPWRQVIDRIHPDDRWCG